jgi:outer membrane protein OmpA-like peptidoglycan-associated protein
VNLFVFPTLFKAAFAVPVMLMVSALAGAAEPVALPAGGEVTFDQVAPAASHALAIAPFGGEGPMLRDVEGHISTQVHRFSGNATNVVDLVRVLRADLSGRGYEMLLDCRDQACGGFDFRFALDVVAPPLMEVSLTDFHYLSAQRTGEVPGWISILISQNPAATYAQIVQIEQTALPPVTTVPAIASEATPESADLPAQDQVPQTDLALALLTTGRMVLEGLVFDSGRATLADDSEGVLQQVAAWLTLNSDASIILVGHTDNEGSLDSNIAVSRKRAETVRQELIDRYQADGERIATEGVGYLVPRASNATEQGRALNRRVEIVLR